jgi:hypothetical protein
VLVFVVTAVWRATGRWTNWTRSLGRISRRGRCRAALRLTSGEASACLWVSIKHRSQCMMRRAPTSTLQVAIEPLVAMGAVRKTGTRIVTAPRLPICPETTWGRTFRQEAGAATIKAQAPASINAGTVAARCRGIRSPVSCHWCPMATARRRGCSRSPAARPRGPPRHCPVFRVTIAVVVLDWQSQGMIVLCSVAHS